MDKTNVNARPRPLQLFISGELQKQFNQPILSIVGIDRSSRSQLRNSQILANLSRRELNDFSMPRNR